MSWNALERGASNNCPRLQAWLSLQDASPSQSRSNAGLGTLEDRLEAEAARLRLARRRLIWIESADVAATRSAVRLAALCDATIHVAQSPGERNLSAVIGSSGFLGTSLSEVHQRAELVVHLGGDHLDSMPMLAPRFLDGNPTDGRKARQQLIVGQDPAWSRGSWLDQFTKVLLALRRAIDSGRPFDSAVGSPNDGYSSSPEQFAHLLLSSRSTVFLWSEAEFADEIDRLLLERVLEIAQVLSQFTRCTLLPLSIDPGRVTAKETLLWLTNLAGTARHLNGGEWIQPTEGFDQSLASWQAAYDWILCLRNLPSDRPLPDLRFDFVLDAHSNANHHRWLAGSESREVLFLPVAAVGLDCGGHLTRVDHALGAYVCGQREHEPLAPRACAVLDALADCLSNPRDEWRGD